MNTITENVDVVVVGAGHAGCEAALACARLGLKTQLFTVSVESIAMMPCNPNIGGTSKGHLVRELDALGGEMGKNIDKTFIQSKMLNQSKGPAVHSLRAQADKAEYSKEMRKVLENTENQTIRQQEVTEMKDKVSYLDIILATKSSVLVTQIAQDYGESSIRFNRRLKEMNIQYQRGKQWILYADYKDCGYVTSETYLIKHKDGTEDVRMNTKWTQKGRRFLYEKLKSVGVIPVIERT